MIELPVHPAAAKACMRASAALAGDIDIVLTATNNRNHQFWQPANPCIKYIQACFLTFVALIFKNASTFNSDFINRAVLQNYIILHSYPSALIPLVVH